jgi:hypothetical protein
MFFIDDFIFGFCEGIIKRQKPFTTAGRHVKNSCQIWSGLFRGSAKQIASRLTWELPQTLTGLTIGHVMNDACLVNVVDNVKGATAINNRLVRITGYNAFTLGSYINGADMIINPKDISEWNWFKHEYGHYLQSRWIGPFYMITVVPVSMITASLGVFGYDHMDSLIEKDATRRGYKKFDKSEINAKI